MTNPLVDTLRGVLGDAVLRDEIQRDEVRVWVKRDAWLKAAQVARDELNLNHFLDLTAVDYIERAPEEDRFELFLLVRSQETRNRLQLLTSVPEDGTVDSLVGVWEGANWAEREVWDMFGVGFDGHPDLRRILLYEQFEGYPLRKDYPIERAQPLVPYREEEDLDKLPPFGADEGQPFGRIDWARRRAGRDQQVSPTLAVHSGQRRTLSDSEAASLLLEKIKAGAPPSEEDGSQA